jgi:hypothetical protein
MPGLARMSDPAVKVRLDKAVGFLDAVMASQLAAKSARASVRWAGRMPRQFECTRLITAEQVKQTIERIPGVL